MPRIPPTGDGDLKGTSASAATRPARSRGRSSGAVGSSTSVIACLRIDDVVGIGGSPGGQGLLPGLRRGDLTESGAVLLGQPWPLATQLGVDRHGLLQQLAVVGG